MLMHQETCSINGDTVTKLAIANQNACKTHRCHQDSMQSFGVDVALEHCGHLSAWGCTQKGGDGNPNQGQPGCELDHQVMEKLIGHNSHQCWDKHNLECGYC